MELKINHEYNLQYGNNVPVQSVIHIGPSEPFSNRPDYCAFVSKKTDLLILHHIQQGNFTIQGDEVRVIDANVPKYYIESCSEAASPKEFNRLSQILGE